MDIEIDDVVVLTPVGGIGKKSGKQWNAAIVRIGDSMIRMFSDIDLAPFKDKVVTLTVRMGNTQDLSPKLSIVKAQ